MNLEIGYFSKENGLFGSVSRATMQDIRAAGGTIHNLEAMERKYGLDREFIGGLMYTRPPVYPYTLLRRFSKADCNPDRIVPVKATFMDNIDDWTFSL